MHCPLVLFPESRENLFAIERYRFALTHNLKAVIKMATAIKPGEKDRKRIRND